MISIKDRCIVLKKQYEDFLDVWGILNIRVILLKCLEHVPFLCAACPNCVFPRRPWASLSPPPPPPRIGWGVGGGRAGGVGGRRGGGYQMLISEYLDHESTQFRLSASELLLFVSVVLVLINALSEIPNRDDVLLTAHSLWQKRRRKKGYSKYYFIVWKV